MTQLKFEEYKDMCSEICANCNCTKGSHHAGSSPYPYDYCPGAEGRMDWHNGPGTTFQSSGEYRQHSSKLIEDAEEGDSCE